MIKSKPKEENKYVLSSGGVSVDLNMVYEVAGNDESFVLLMVDTFLKNMPVTIQEIKTLCKQQDWFGLYQKAHYAKSTLSVIKINEILPVLKKVEVNSKSKENLEEIQLWVDEVSNLYYKAEQTLLAHFQNIKTNA